MYPVMLNIKNKVCTVVGGGRGAFVKAKKLIEQGAAVFVIAPKLCDEMKRLNLCLISAEYDPKLVPESFLVIAATDNKQLNERICAEARKNKSLVLNLSDPEKSDFICPASFESESLAAAVSTKGNFPRLAAYMSRDMEKEYEEFDAAARYLGELRRNMRGKSEKSRGGFFSLCVSEEMMEVLKKQGFEEYKKRIEKLKECALF